MARYIATDHYDAIIEAVTGFLTCADISKSAELTIKVDRESVPTLSYVVEEMPVIPTRKGE